jgi:trans-aconitate methyltransferase
MCFLLYHARPNKFRYVVDLGCGVGVYYELVKRHFPSITYTGFDYSEAAINIAYDAWDAKPGTFCLGRYEDITRIDEASIVLASGLCDVMPDGDKCVRSIVELNPQAMLLQRIRTTGRASYATKYRAYSNVDTYAFYHNAHNLLTSILDEYEVDYDRFDDEGTLDIIAYK